MKKLSEKEKETLFQVFQENGATKQLLIVIQELAELQEALTNYMIAEDSDLSGMEDIDCLVEETADVLIGLQYIPICTCAKKCDIENIVHGKLERLNRWVESDDFEKARKKIKNGNGSYHKEVIENAKDSM